MKNRRQRMEEDPSQVVTRVERLLLDGPEHLAFARGAPVFPERGGIAFMHMLHQVMDGENVVALNLTISGERLPEIRRLDNKLEMKISRLVGKAVGPRKAQGKSVMLRLYAIIG